MEDFRIEATLMREIKNTKPSKSFRKEPSPAFQMVLLNESIHNIRIEATLALSDFNTPSSVEFLKTGLDDEQIAPYCGAALYKLTGDEKYLNSIEKSIKEDEKDVVLADFLRRFNNLKAQKLAKKLTLF
jgi:HEAT repeat protein